LANKKQPCELTTKNPWVELSRFSRLSCVRSL